MQEVLDKLAIRLCKNLPFDFTIYERNGFCRKPNQVCDYCRKNGDDTYFCNKKTYTLNQEFRLV